MPLFSILIPAYNHERFVQDCLRSILAQTFQDFEVILLDDCSGDKTYNLACEIKDSRIRCLRNDYNKGINANLNTLIVLAKGEFITFIASDDKMKPPFLDRMKRVFEEQPNTQSVYCAATPIDDEGQEILDRKNKYVRQNRGRFEILKDLFLKANKLSAPGMTFRKVCALSILPLNIGILQTQDYEMNVKLLLAGDVYVTEECWIWYRRRSHEGNVSALTPDVIARTECEESHIMNTFLSIKDPCIYESIFGEKISTTHPYAIRYALACKALQAIAPIKRKWGYDQIVRILNEPNGNDILWREEGVDFKSCMQRIKSVSGGKDVHKRMKRYQSMAVMLAIIIFILLVVIIFLFFRYV